MGKEDAIKKSVVYSAMEVAKICGVVNQTAINWIRNNYLKASTTPGGQFRVYPDDLVEFMEKNDMQVPVEVLENSERAILESIEFQQKAQEKSRKKALPALKSA